MSIVCTVHKLKETPPTPTDSEELADRLDALDSALQPLIVMSREQSQEIDELLNLYEQTVPNHRTVL